MQPAVGEHVGDLLGRAAVLEGQTDDRRREKQERPREDDRHDARVVHLQRHVLRLAAVHFPAHDALRVLHRDLAHALRHGDDRRDHDEEERHHQDENRRIDLTRARSAAEGTNVFQACTSAAGRRATMPIVMISEMPLPMPRSVI